MDSTPVTARSLGRTYYVNGDNLGRIYKNHLSGYADDKHKELYIKWALNVKNMGIHLGIDETKIGRNVYTILINKDAHGHARTIIAYSVSTQIRTVSDILLKIPRNLRDNVQEVTMDFSDSMRGIVKTCFPQARITLDCFHVMKMICDAVEERRLRCKREAIKELNKLRAAFKKKLKKLSERRSKYRKGHPKRYKGHKRGRKPTRKFKVPKMSNGETLLDVMIRSRAQLMESGDKWNENQKKRYNVIKNKYPEVARDYELLSSIRSIFRNRKLDREAARIKLHEWYDKVKKCTSREMKSARDLIKIREEDILNYFIDRSSNALSESLNSRIKRFLAQSNGTRDTAFFMYRVFKIFG